jgi:protein-S-isoprenylcysteine O-methyltransferase Ste14
VSVPRRERLFRFVFWLEPYGFLLLYGYFFFMFAISFVGDPNPVDALYVFDQTILMIFISTRREAIEITKRPLDCAIALLATFLPLLAVPNSGVNIIPETACIALMLMGTLLHIFAKLSLRRSFGILPADRGIKSGGAYLFVRHPMYLGYIVVQVGMMLAGPVAWNIVLFAIIWSLYLWRIHIEERLLGRSDDYQALCVQTRYRLIPGLY